MLLSADLFRVGKIGLSEETYVFDQLSESQAAPDRLKETTGANNTERDSIKIHLTSNSSNLPTAVPPQVLHREPATMLPQ